jgi:glycosyltransferase involved in cell wall biosynthesis
VTKERTARRFEELGVHKPHYVVSQGVSLGTLSQQEVAAVRGEKANGGLVVGYHAAWILSGEDRGGGKSVNNIDHLLELWDEIHARVPEAQLWLIGGASPRIVRRCAERDDIRVFGRLPRERMLPYVANFDIALYPRTRDEGIQSAKVQEYLALGVPTVSYDFEVTSELRETGGGLLVETGRDFVAAVERLARDEPERRRVAELARTAGAGLDWDVLAQRYAEILDLHLRP